MTLNRHRPLRIGETKQKGDEYLHNGYWHKVGATLGSTVMKRDSGHFRTRRPLPAFYRK